MNVRKLYKEELKVYDIKLSVCWEELDKLNRWIEQHHASENLDLYEKYRNERDFWAKEVEKYLELKGELTKSILAFESSRRTDWKGTIGTALINTTANVALVGAAQYIQNKGDLPVLSIKDIARRPIK